MQHKAFTLLVLGLCTNLCATAWSSDPNQELSGTKRALLIGCTKYEMPGIPELWGPANDIPLWRKTLTEQFGFPDAQMRILLGWPDDPSARPTHANIVRAFESLIDTAGIKDQVVIVLSGHGAQVPSPLGEKFHTGPKLDGLDEVFLPADVKSWTSAGVENAIKDYEFAGWLERLRNKGAEVWIVFDCCHSGTMARGISVRERPRTVKPSELGIPDTAIADALQRAKDAPAPQSRRGHIPRRPDGSATGSLVAFYAAQSFEESPELPRPGDMPQVRENYYGLFSYTLNSALRQRRSPLTYRELSQIVGAQYRAERKSRPPTAFAEGDLDREVLGLRVWPHRSDILLSSNGEADSLSINAGELQGLTAGSILAIHPPAGDARPAMEILGYVETVEPGLTSAKVRTHAFDRESPIAVSAIPDQARCEIVARGLGDLRVRYVVIADVQRASKIRNALHAMTEEIRNLTTEVDDPATAEWWIRDVGDRVQLVQGQGKNPIAKGAASVEVKPTGGKAVPEVVFQEYSFEPLDRLTAGLERDLQKLFRWQNLWHVTSVLKNDSTPGRDLGLRIEIRVFDGPGAGQSWRLEDRPALHPGQWIEVRLINDGSEDLWVTLLALDSRFGIQDIPVVSIPSSKSTTLERIEVTDESFGPEGLIALAYPIESQRDRPHFDFFLQEPIGRPDPQKMRAISPKTPFGDLMKSAAFGTKTRNIRRQISTEPQIASSVWITLPSERKRSP